MSDFWLNMADQIVGQAEEAAAEGLVRSHFGKLEATNRYVKWVEGTPVDISQDEYIVLVGNKDTRRQAMLEITFKINEKDMNPYLEWEYYERKVRVGGPDWRKTLVPSIEAIYGKDSMKKERGKTLSSLIGSYVEAHDVPQQPIKNDKHINQTTGEPYNTIKIAGVFKDRDECYTAYVARFGEPTPSGVETLPDVPDGYDSPEEWEEMKTEVKGFIRRRLHPKEGNPMPDAEVVQAGSAEYGLALPYVQTLLDEVRADAE